MACGLLVMLGLAPNVSSCRTPDCGGYFVGHTYVDKLGFNDTTVISTFIGLLDELGHPRTDIWMCGDLDALGRDVRGPTFMVFSVAGLPRKKEKP